MVGEECDVSSEALEEMANENRLFQKSQDSEPDGTARDRSVEHQQSGVKAAFRDTKPHSQMEILDAEAEEVRLWRKQ